MRKMYLLAIGVWALFSTTSCTRHFLPAMYLHEDAYMSKPFLSPADSTTHYRQGVYVMGRSGVSTQLSLGENDATQISSNMLQIHQAHSFKQFNLAYGVQGTLGNADVPPPDETAKQYTLQEAGNKSFQALGMRAEANYKAPFTGKHFELRVIGGSFGYTKELGKYLRFRQNLVPTKSLFYSRGDEMYAWGLHTEFCWKFGKRNPLNERNGMSVKFGYTKNYFPHFVKELNHSDILEIQENMATSFVFVFKNVQIIYQTASDIDIPIPVFAGVFHAFGVNFNLASLWDKPKTK